MNDKQIRSAFDHLETDVKMNVNTEEGLEKITGTRRPARRPVVAALAGAAVVALVIGAAVLFALPGGDPEPGPPATGASTTSVVETTTPTTALPALPVAPLGTALIADLDVAVIEEGDGYVAYIAERIVGDGSGGVVIQVDDRLIHIPSDIDGRDLVDADEWAADAAPVTIRLEDIVVIDGSPHVLYVVSGGSVQQPYGEVWTYDFDSGESTLRYRRDAVESTIGRVSLANDTMVVTIAEEGTTYFEFLDGDGRPIDVANPIAAGASTRFQSPLFGGVLSPDGATLVYLQGVDVLAAEEGYLFIDLVEWDLVNAVEVRRQEIDFNYPASPAVDGPNSFPSRLDFDGVGVVLGREQRLLTGSPAVAPLRIESLDDGIVTELGQAGSPSLVKVAIG